MVAFLLISIFILGLVAYGYRYRLHEALKNNQGLVSLASNLYGQLIQSEKRANELGKLAHDALECAKEANHVTPDMLVEWSAPPRGTEEYDVQVRNYVPQIATNCPKCGVSVRHPPEVYPVRCPAADCRELIDPTFDDPPTFQ